MVVSLSWCGLSVVLVYKIGFISLIYNWLFYFLFELVGFTFGKQTGMSNYGEVWAQKKWAGFRFRKPTRQVRGRYRP